MQGPLPLQAEEQPWIDCCLRGHMPLLQVTTNLLYHCSVKSLGWLSSKAKEEWKIHKFDHGWWRILKRSWHSKLPLVAKVFIGEFRLEDCLYHEDIHFGLSRVKPTTS